MAYDTGGNQDFYNPNKCEHCEAPYGHFNFCPLLNRASAEAASRLAEPTEADRIAAHALGVKL